MRVKLSPDEREDFEEKAHRAGLADNLSAAGRAAFRAWNPRPVAAAAGDEPEETE